MNFKIGLLKLATIMRDILRDKLTSNKEENIIQHIRAWTALVNKDDRFKMEPQVLKL